MLNIDEISDYRDLLKDYYVQRKLEFPLYSYKMMGQKLGLETSQMFRVLNKEFHLPTRSVPLAKDLLKLKGRDGELFEILVAVSKTKSQAKRDKLYKMALALKDVKMRSLDTNELQFLSKWWIPVVRTTLEMNGGDAITTKLMRQIRPALSKEQVEDAIRILRELELITPLASNRYAITQANFTTAGAAKVTAIRSYQNQLLALAQDSIVNVSPDMRNISSLLVGVDEECFEDLKNMTLEFRRQVQKRVEEVPKATRAMQFVFALYPVSDVAENEPSKNESSKKGLSKKEPMEKERKK